MQPIKYLKGDATAPYGPGAKIIAHVCNDVGGWGRGFVLAISARWREPEAAYRQWYRDRAANDFGLGAVQLVTVASELAVANMVGQAGVAAVHGIPPVRYEAIDACLAKVAALAIAQGANVHMPRIGCGLGQGTWDRIEPLVLRRLAAEGVRTFVYDLA